MAQKKQLGNVIVPPKADIWPHELITANALVNAGHAVEFRINKNREFTKSADILIDSRLWEIKSPTSSKLAAILRKPTISLKILP